MDLTYGESTYHLHVIKFSKLKQGAGFRKLFTTSC